MSVTIQADATIAAAEGLTEETAVAIAAAASAAAGRGYQVTIAAAEGVEHSARNASALQKLELRQGDVVTVAVTGPDVDKAADVADTIFDLLEAAGD